MSAMHNVGLAVAQQALVTGQVLNALNGAPVTAASLLLETRLPGETEFRPLRAKLRFTSAGYFCAIGIAEQVLPQGLAADAELALRFRVTAPRFEELVAIVALAAAAVTVVPDEGTVADHTLPLRLISAPVVHQVLALQPLPVGIAGWVISDHDFNAPLAGVSVHVTEPVVQAPVISDAQGRFRIDTLPVAESVTLQVEGSDSSTTIKHVIDYTTPFNTRIISLNG